MPRLDDSPRDAAIAILRSLRAAGHIAYLAGGCVRDALLGLEPKDYDIATDAHPTAVREILPRSRYVGEAFGVVLAHKFGHAIEVATFRAEAGYHDKRRPSHVTFTDAKHDAQRRDFTINGLFADPLTCDPQTGADTIIDYVNGRDDLLHKRVRAIGDPDQRFAEDYLRMLRAVRFAARLDFEIEAHTAAAIRPLARYLGQISRERIGQEIALMLTGPRSAEAASLVQDLSLDAPALNEEHMSVDLPILSALADQHVETTYALPAALGGWLLDRHGPPAEDFTRIARFCEHQARPIVRRWRKALCLSNHQRDQLNHMLWLVARAYEWPHLPIARRKRLLADAHWPLTLVLLRALPLGQTLQSLENDAAELHAQGIAPAPLVTGDDLIKMGATPGPAFRELLDGVYDAQLAGVVHDREQALRWLAQHADVNG